MSIDSDEMYTGPDGTSVPVSSLTEEQAKTILRELLKRDREDLSYIQSIVMPMLDEVISDVEHLTIIVNEHGVDSVKTFTKGINFTDIDDAFNRASISPRKDYD